MSERKGERKKGREKESKREKENERESERKCVCVIEREREIGRGWCINMKFQCCRFYKYFPFGRRRLCGIFSLQEKEAAYMHGDVERFSLQPRMELIFENFLAYFGRIIETMW